MSALETRREISILQWKSSVLFLEKTFTTPVNYTISIYYITKIICEMAALQTHKLLFLTYSTESTSVVEATFDETLWQMICEIVCDVYGDSRKIPTRLHPLVPILRQKEKDYNRKNVRFLAEVPFVRAIECLHQRFFPGDHGHLNHQRQPDVLQNNLDHNDLFDAFHRSKTVLQMLYQLQR
ncbi:hypothetical protein FSP39_006344 [Pinctada imbricata]|uniref:Uncharacterized protein n=1 Tax=Pinctada imbricata TaxID=66713 RepID=A0AA88YHN5_PINIB|nr:hypothetical protein FSP39_006344 [Pinctada imbricata]